MHKHIVINTEELYYYLKDLKKIPVISHDRQLEIFEILKNCEITDIERDKLKEELVVGNLRFVITIAKSYQNLGLDLLDLISEGNIGLLKCMDNFDHTKGVKFISYGVWWIKQSIMSALNDYSRTIRIPSNLIQESQKQKKEVPNDSSDKVDSVDSLPYCVGLYDEINEEGDQLIDIIRDPNEENPENIMKSDIDLKARVNKALSVLDERERIIIEKSFGINGFEVSNLEDLGEEFNCTKERVRQIKDKSIKKLRNESFSFFKYL